MPIDTTESVGLPLGIVRQLDNRYTDLELDEADYISPAEAVPTFAALTLEAGWSNFGGAYQVPEYTKTISNEVILRGLVTGSGGVLPVTIATLPVGHRPASTQTFSVVNDGAYGQVHVDAAGLVQLIVGNSGGYVGLAGIRFFV